MRVASMLASATEIVAALGFRDALVARSHECDFPAGVEALPCCTEPKIDLRGTSRYVRRSSPQVRASRWCLRWRSPTRRPGCG